jgi:DNA-binding NarL/FixJ family response regulator
VPGGTLLVSRSKKLFPYYRQKLEAMGYTRVEATGEEKDSLNMVINEVKPRLVLVGSGFYHAGTPYMMGRLLKNFPKLNIAAVSLGEYPDSLAAWFIWHGVTSYISLLEGLEEFYFGMAEIRKGNAYISPSVRRLIDDFPEWPKTPDKITRRQMEVLLLICNGFSAEGIGKTLAVSRATVHFHLQELYHTFHVKNRETLIKTAFALKLVTDKDLVFYDRQPDSDLPEWALIKRKIEKEHTAKSAPKRIL